jgi:outer membrane protein assembly factor BamB
VDGDGRAELLCAATEGAAVLPRLRAEIVGLAGGGPKVRWGRDGAGFVQADLPRLGPDWSTSATQGMRQALLTEGPRPAFLVLESEPGKDRLTLKLSALRGNSAGGIETLWVAQGLPSIVEGLAIAGPGPGGETSAVLRVVQPAQGLATIEAENCTLEVAARRARGTAPHSPVAARLEPGGPVCVVVQGAGEEIFCIRPPARGGKPEVIWRRSGRGIGNGAQPGTLALADLLGDGRREVIAAGQTPSGGAEVVALRGDGSLLWRRSFPGFPGETPVHNIGGLAYYWPGRFRSADRADLFVNLRRGLMHSDLGVLLDGRTGEEVWRREKAIAPEKFRWGFSGAPLAVADLFGDRREELVCLYPVCFWVADGSTGDFLAAEELASRKVVPAWAAYGEPMVWDFDGDGTREVLLDSPYLLALLDRDGKPRWHGKPKADYPTGNAEDNLGETTSIRHALLDLDGDGRLEIASAGYKDGVRAIDPRDGAVLWSLEAPAPTVPRCSAADLDGDGGEELLYAAGNQLVAVKGDRKSGRILWTFSPGPGALSLPAIADLDGDGRAEIVVQSADGVLRVIAGK